METGGGIQIKGWRWSMEWLTSLLVKPVFETGLMLGQLLAVGFWGLAVFLLIKKDIFSAIAALVLGLLLAGVPLTWVIVIAVAGLLIFLTLFRLMSLVAVTSWALVMALLIAVLPALWFNAIFKGNENLERAMARKGVVMYDTPAAQTADTTTGGTGNGDQGTTTEKVLRENAAAVWWAQVNRNPTEKPSGGFIPQGVTCTFVTHQSPLTTAVGSEKWDFRCWQGDQDSPAWKSAEVVVNGFLARAAGATIKKDVTSQIAGYGEWPEAAYETRAVEKEPETKAPEAKATEEAGSSSSGGTTTTYKVQPGDTLGRIASQYGVSVDALAKANGITNVNVIVVDQVLTIPSGP